MKTLFFVCLITLGQKAVAQRTVRQDRIKLSLAGIFISGHILTFDFLVYNHSLLDYELQYIKFLIRERHLAIRTALQEREILPLSPITAFQLLSDTSQHLILQFSQFGIPRTQELIIVVKEKNGFRDLSLHISGHRFLKMIRTKNEEGPPVFNNQKN